MATPAGAAGAAGLLLRLSLLVGGWWLADGTAPVGTYLGTQIHSDSGCAVTGVTMDSTSAAFDACVESRETCFGVYSPTCEGGPYILCTRVADGDSTVAGAPDEGGCVAETVFVTAAPTPAPTPAPAAEAIEAAAAELILAAEDAPAAPAPAPAPATPEVAAPRGAAAAAPPPTPGSLGFAAINAYDCDTVTCSLPGHPEVESCRHHMEDLMTGGHTGSMPESRLSCEAAHSVLLRSETCRGCLACDLCEKNVTGNLMPQRLFRQRRRPLEQSATRALIGLPLRAFALLAAAVTAAAAAAALLQLSMRLSRCGNAPARRELALGEEMGYTDVLATDEPGALCVE